MPVAGPDEVVLKVRAAGVNNTDINTRLDWYSPSVARGLKDLLGERVRWGSSKS